jgi:hypothetical protein
MGYWMERARQLRGEAGDDLPDVEASLSVQPQQENQPSTTEVIDSPTAPLQSGWLVAYWNRHGTLCGGCDDREHGTVDRCVWDGRSWSVCLTDGQRLPITAIGSVGQTDPTGRLVAAWTVRAHGLDGQRDSSDTERATPQ